MRTTFASVGSRVAVLAGAIGGGVAGAGTASSRSVDAATNAACLARVPGSAARCDSDRFVATTGPFLGPTFVGVVLGVIAVALVLLLVRAVVRAVTGSRRAPTVVAGGPAWLLAPVAGRSGRCGVCGGPMAPGRGAAGGSACASCSTRR